MSVIMILNIFDEVIWKALFCLHRLTRCAPARGASPLWRGRGVRTPACRWPDTASLVSFSESSIHTCNTLAIVTFTSPCALNQGRQLAVAVGFKQRPKSTSSDGLLTFPELSEWEKSVQLEETFQRFYLFIYIYIYIFDEILPLCTTFLSAVFF